MKKIDINELIDEFMFWITIILGFVALLGLIGFMIFVATQTTRWLLVLPIALIIVLRREIRDYLMGIFTLDSSKLPRDSL